MNAVFSLDTYGIVYLVQSYSPVGAALTERQAAINSAYKVKLAFCEVVIVIWARISCDGRRIHDFGA